MLLAVFILDLHLVSADRQILRHQLQQNIVALSPSTNHQVFPFQPTIGPVDRLGLAPSGKAIERRALSIASASVNSPARYCLSVAVIFNHFTLAVRSTDA